MNFQRFTFALLITLLAGPLCAQTPAKPLNLKLPPTTLPIVSSSAPTKANAKAPGVYFGDTSGRRYSARSLSNARANCDDNTYNNAQVHGDVGVGVAGGKHISGNYQTGTVNLSRAFGSCSHPTGNINISVSVGRGEFHDHGH